MSGRVWRYFKQWVAHNPIYAGGFIVLVPSLLFALISVLFLGYWSDWPAIPMLVLFIALCLTDRP